MKDKAIFKFNSGMLAILCSNCSRIIKTGRDFNKKEKYACSKKGLNNLPPQYCDKCRDKL